MKFEQFVEGGAEAAGLLDLGKPSLEALSHVLRHRELWPADFSWNYAECHSCACGLAVELWTLANRHWDGNGEIYNAAQDALGMTNHGCEFDNIFSGAAGFERGLNRLVTPARVADLIDEYLATRP